jgi:hypothetical protein
MTGFRNTNPNAQPTSLGETIKNIDPRILAVGTAAAVGAGALASTSGSKTPEIPNRVETPTTHVEYVAQPGDTLSGIAADIENKGKTTIPMADIEKHLHTKINPDAPGSINPNDDILQVHEIVEGNIPANAQAEAQLAEAAKK